MFKIKNHITKLNISNIVETNEKKLKGCQYKNGKRNKMNKKIIDSIFESMIEDITYIKFLSYLIPKEK